MSPSLDTTSFDQALGLFMSNSKRDIKVVLRQQAKLLTALSPIRFCAAKLSLAGLPNTAVLKGGVSLQQSAVSSLAC